MKNTLNFLALFLLLSLFSCSNKSPGNSNSEENANTSESTAPAASNKSIESSKPTENDYLHNWVKDEDPNCTLTISKEGPTFVVTANCGHAGDYSYSMTESGTLSGYNGMVTISYIKETDKILLVYPPNKIYYSKI